MREHVVFLIDRSQFRPRLRDGLAFIAYALFLYLAPIALLLALLSLIARDTGTATHVLAALPLIFISASGLIMLASCGHEGWHFNLSPNKTVSCALGIFFSAAMPLFVTTGYFSFHWQHHRHVNTEHDPDYLYFRDYHGAIKRLLLARVRFALEYIRVTFAIALGEKKHALPLHRKQTQRLALFNIFSLFFWLSTYATALWNWPQLRIPLLCSMALALVLSNLNPYQEHAFPSGDNRGYARSRISRCVTWLHGGSNFHVEHHLYPSIPCWYLPRVHNELRKSGWYDNQMNLIDDKFLGSYRYALRRYTYGSSK